MLNNSHEVIVISRCCVVLKVLEVNFISQETTEAAKPFLKLRAFLRTIGHKLQCRSVVLVVLHNPFSHGHLIQHFHLLATDWVFEMLSITALVRMNIDDDLLV
eukprot:Blabericola_migrator_1__12963@NODE_859_length_6239_cov_134_489469_g609_i0_p6_GENE_NODE_859_length_6239_cov_134_489469_g609_i0NODE_859_length_6239_cov_134_489469_g609_i0_p6_ORF_typecomplete_len103_score14_00_NODE_859_length_6239_cov_134_489469_g609_i056365944